MIEQIKQILEDELWATDLSTREDWKARVGGKDNATQRIMELIERQPIDPVRAMAATIYQNHMGDYKVQGGGMSCLVWEHDEWHCSSPTCSFDCIHIQAVKLHLAAQETRS